MSICIPCNRSANGGILVDKIVMNQESERGKKVHINILKDIINNYLDGYRYRG